MCSVFCHVFCCSSECQGSLGTPVQLPCLKTHPYCSNFLPHSPQSWLSVIRSHALRTALYILSVYFHLKPFCYITSPALTWKHRLLNLLDHSAGCCQRQDLLLPQTPGSHCKDSLQSNNCSACGKGCWMHLSPVVNMKCYMFFLWGVMPWQIFCGKGMWVLTTEQLTIQWKFSSCIKPFCNKSEASKLLGKPSVGS